MPLKLFAVAALCLASCATVDVSNRLIPPTYLAVGDAQTVPIHARAHWNPTGILVKPGEQYELTVYGNQGWKDWTISSDATGYRSLLNAPFAHFRRSPNQRWFVLMLSLGTVHDETTKPIGVHAKYTAARAGEITCYANDAWRAYWNNHRVIWLEIRRLS